MNPAASLLGLFSPSSAKGTSLPGIATPIQSSATSSLDSSGSYYNLSSGNSPINFSPSNSSLLIIGAVALIGLLIFKGRI